MTVKAKNPNHPFVVWATCCLWLFSLFAIISSLILFFCVGDILLLTDTDLVNAFVLLTGLVMLPTHVNMLCLIANGKRINHKAKVMCCPLWLSILWIIIICAVAAAVCLLKIYSCGDKTTLSLYNSMKYYRSVQKYKHFMDNLQWSLKCCGLNSYKDWFTHDWYDKIRDYEWDPSLDKHNKLSKKSTVIADSVPLSCCKSGSCISNYLTELGTYSINTNGCAPLIFRIVTISMGVHLAFFIIIIIVEAIILKLISKEDKPPGKSKFGIRSKKDVRHIMQMKDNFDASSGSCVCNPEDSEDMELSGAPEDTEK